MRRFAAVLAVAVLAPTAAALAGAADPGTVVITQGVDASTLDPLKASVTPDTNVQAQIFDTLARRSADGTSIQPQLATSWKRIAPAIWEFRLRRGVTFSNGDPFTSADVKFSVEKILDPAYKSQQVPRVDTIVKVETPDPYTVRFVTKRPTPLAPAITRPIFIADAKYWTEHGDAYIAEHPMGTGPYVLASWRRDDALELAVNPHWWGGTPPASKVIFKPIPEAGTRVSALRTGAADLITNVPYQYATLLAGGTSTRMASAKSVRVLFIAFNTLQPGPQQNVLVRQALNYAIDVPAIVKAVLGGRAYELGEPLPANFFGYDPALPSYAHDLAKAKALLAKAGYPDGKGLNLALYGPQGRYNSDKEVALAIAGQLQAAGVHVDVHTEEWVSYYRRVLQRQVSPMYLLGWGNITYDADNTLSSQLTSDAVSSTYANPAFDKLVDAARYELDPAKRRALYAKAMRIVHDDAPWLFLFEYEDLYATSKRLHWQPRPDEAIYVTEMRLQ
ncbi:ABC transporter substrate-binding protein [Vulcanimicrobium alpinum]|uniref:ABC transporter substrate-binding protein n=1 Tax=Vulcanimicrobium alpinum TaxID=3016050 RepID=A0AAN1XU35_UNVUL|nr:ABC transporter substrate-binding protein [Vulcanimicrobium alpinum]BDE05600.1 ABC transporter substrate-binding protein [Vulcanimicrobium alpinum]